MATKTKTSETSASAPVPSVEKVFSQGLEQLNAGDLVAAGTSFKFVQEEAISQDRLGLGRTARGYLAAIQARLQEQDAASAGTPELTAQLMLNKNSAATALEVVDRALYRRLEEEGYRLPVLEIAAKYLRPAHYDDTLTLVTTMREKPLLRIRLEYEVRRGGELLATGASVHAFIDREGRPVRPPPSIVARMGESFRE